MDKEQFELYEYARKRATQKKGVLSHLITLVIGILFLYILSQWLGAFPEMNWFPWVSAIWIFTFLIHASKVFITNTFMGKEWEKKQIEKLVVLQKNKIIDLQNKLDKNTPTT